MKFNVDLTERELNQIYYCHLEKLDNINDSIEAGETDEESWADFKTMLEALLNKLEPLVNKAETYN